MEYHMGLPPLRERTSLVLIEETKRLQAVYTEIATIADTKKMGPAFAKPLNDLNDTIAAIQAELDARD